MNVQTLTVHDVPTNKPRTTIYLEPEIFKALEDRAKAEKRSISNLCNLLIEQAMLGWIQESPPEPKKTPTSKAKRV
ncbi:ribbon-helix-helix domain-containing protein [Phormidium nigroviride]